MPPNALKKKAALGQERGNLNEKSANTRTSSKTISNETAAVKSDPQTELFSGNSHLLNQLRVPFKNTGSGDLAVICPCCKKRMVLAGNQPWSHCLTLGCEARDWAWNRVIAELGGAQ